MAVATTEPAIKEEPIVKEMETSISRSTLLSSGSKNMDRVDGLPGIDKQGRKSPIIDEKLVIESVKRSPRLTKKSNNQ